VHSFLGNGFQEVIYQRALAYKLNQKNLGFEREIEHDVFYKDYQNPSVQEEPILWWKEKFW